MIITEFSFKLNSMLILQVWLRSNSKRTRMTPLLKSNPLFTIWKYIHTGGWTTFAIDTILSWMVKVEDLFVRCFVICSRVKRHNLVRITPAIKSKGKRGKLTICLSWKINCPNIYTLKHILHYSVRIQHKR